MTATRGRYLALLILVGSPFGAVNAEALYRWIDSEGQPHFGDQPPPAGAEQVQQLPPPQFAAPNVPPAQNHYSINNQLRRMEEARLAESRERWQREQQRREYELRQRELEARENPPPVSSPTPVYAYPRYRPSWPQHPASSWPNPNQQPRSLWKPDAPVYQPYSGRPHHHRSVPTTGSRIVIDLEK